LSKGDSSLEPESPFDKLRVTSMLDVKTKNNQYKNNQ